METPTPMGWPTALESRQAKLEPFDWYHRKLSEGPLDYDETRGCWDVFGYDAVTEVLTDPETYSSVTATGEDRNALPSMLSADPPQHTRLREPVEEYFRPGEVRTLEPEIRETTRGLLEEADADADGGGVDVGESRRLDVVDDLAWPLPIHTIATLLGVPPQDREQFKEWSDAVVSGTNSADANVEELDDEQSSAAIALANYFAEVCAERREEPRDDLVSKVLFETDLTDVELLGLFRLLLVAGNVTTTNLVTNAVWCLCEEDELETVREDPDLVDAAIEETLRYRSPVQRTVRRATEATELCGRHLEAGDRLAVWLGAANRDPDRFDEPDRFDLGRSPNPHVAFGRGIHVCLGAPLSRLEARVALETLLSRYDTISRVDVDHDPYVSPFIYGVQQLPVTVDGGRSSGS